MRKKYYVAYGSNLNIIQMAHRCPTAEIAGNGYIEDWQLAFRGSKTGAYLTIEPKKGSSVPVGIWEITEADEAALDRYEGFPTFYRKETINVKVQNYLKGTAQEVEALVYIMTGNRPVGLPSTAYVETCLEGCMDFYIEDDAIWEAINRAKREVRK